MSWTKDNGKIAKEAAEQAIEAVDYLDEKKPLIDKFTDEQTNLQAQINQLVADGDSSPEAAQARVGVDDTEYSTLKVRLDEEYNQVTQQLAQITNRTENFVARQSNRFIAHMGAKNLAPENTLSAIQNAIRLGYKLVEFDLITSSDGHFVALHDTTLDRTTSGTGLVYEKTLSYIKSLNIISGTNLSLYPNEKVPTLDEILVICKRYNVAPVVDLKFLVNVSDYDTLINTLRKHGMEETAIIISFNLAYLQQLRARSSKVILCYGYEITTETIQAAVDLQNCMLVVADWSVTSAKIQQAHDAKIPIAVYTVDDYTHATTFLKNGADFIITNQIGGVS